MITELIWSGAVFLIAFAAMVTASKIIRKKNNPVVTFESNNINIQWKTHTIVFNFIYVDDQLHYDGADCNEKYSCSLASTTKHKYPWKLWMKCGNDELTIITDLKSKYEVI